MRKVYHVRRNGSAQRVNRDRHRGRGSQGRGTALRAHRFVRQRTNIALLIDHHDSCGFVIGRGS